MLLSATPALNNSIPIINGLHPSQQLFTQWSHWRGHKTDSCMFPHLPAEPGVLVRSCPRRCAPGDPRGHWKELQYPLHSRDHDKHPTPGLPKECFQPVPSAAQMCLPRPVWRQQAAVRGVPHYEDQAEIPSSFTWSRSIFLHFPFVQESYICAWTCQTGELLVWSCSKLLTSICITEWLWEISVWDGSQGNLSRHSGKGKEVQQQWWIAGIDLHVSLLSVSPTIQQNIPLHYSTSTHLTSSYIQKDLCAVIRLSLPSHTHYTSWFPPTLLPHHPAHPHQRKHFLPPVTVSFLPLVKRHATASYTPAFPAALAQLGKRLSEKPYFCSSTGITRHSVSRYSLNSCASAGTPQMVAATVASFPLVSVFHCLKQSHHLGSPMGSLPPTLFPSSSSSPRPPSHIFPEPPQLGQTAACAPQNWPSF